MHVRSGLALSILALVAALPHAAQAQRESSLADSLRVHAIVMTLHTRRSELGDGRVDECSVLRALNSDSVLFAMYRRDPALEGIKRSGPLTCERPPDDVPGTAWIKIDHIVALGGIPIRVDLIAGRQGFRFESFILERPLGHLRVREIQIRPTIPNNDYQELVPPKVPPTRQE